LKRALLVNPWIYDFKCHDFWIKPYGLLRISTFLKENGFETDMIDCMDRHDKNMKAYGTKDRQYGRGDFYQEELEKSALYKKVPRKYKRYGFPLEVFNKKLEMIKPPDVVLMASSVTYSYEGVFLAVKIISERFPQARIILGGIYATLCQEHAKKHSGAAHVWKGGIDNNFIAVLNQFAKSEANKLSAAGLNEILPDYSFYTDTPYRAVKFTQGCPFSCTYCAIKQFSETYYQRDKEGILKELEGYAEKNIKNIAFYDDALLYKNYFIKGILKEVIKRNYKFSFHASNGLHAAYIDEETAALMKKAGFIEPKISLESSNADLQKISGGKVTNEVFERAINNLKKAGFAGKDMGIFILNGLPGQDEISVMKDVDYLKGLGLKIRHSVYSPIPGTLDFMKLRPDIGAELINEPLKQNEYYFLAINTEYNWEANLRVKAAIDEHNTKLGEQAGKEEDV
jgi:radical SAM superfamily enzyme YgiQ (UPF0313 family)